MGFRHFYQHYLGLHQNRTCRRLHLIGLFAGMSVLVACLCAQRWLFICAGPVLGLMTGYAFSWVGHLCFEHNTPATWRHPWYSFRGDLHMVWDVLRGRLKI